SEISGVTQKIRNFLPFSPPKEGPLTDIMDVKWGETIAEGILKGERDISKAMERALNFDLTKKATFDSHTNDRNNNDVVRLLVELIEVVKNKDLVIDEHSFWNWI